MNKLTVAALIVLAGTLLSCSGGKREVVIYVSEDQVFSEPILRDFEKETGIKVKSVFDTEESKSTGVMNRLIAEKDNPQADVYWANEPIRADILRQQGIADTYISPGASSIPAQFKDPKGYWTGFSSRARVLIVNNRVADKPQSIRAYADPRWRGRTVIANPLFGTTTTYIAALYILWGDAAAAAFMDSLKTSGIKLSTSNGESADQVANGEFDFSLVDSDDAVNRMRQGLPVTMIIPDQDEGGAGCFLVPNAALLIKGAPHPENARKLIDYLLSKETERKLAFADCAQIPLHPGVEIPKDIKQFESLRPMNVDYVRVAKKMQEIQGFLKAWAGY